MDFARVQRLIEPCWSHLFFFSGLPLIRGRTGHRVTILFDGLSLMAELPYLFNRVVSAHPGPHVGEFTLETEHPHLLCEGKEAQVIGTDRTLFGPFEVVSRRRFIVHQPVRVSSATYLFIPANPDLCAVARDLNAQLNAPFPCPIVQLRYDPCLSRFVFALLTDKHGCTATLLIDEDALDLGFRCGEHRFTQACPLVATSPPLGTSSIQLSTGNYTIEQMLEEINLRFNCCFVVPGSTLTLGTTLGTQTITVPAGSYTPPSLAATLTQLLLPLLDVRVRFHETRYEFSSTSQIFSLEFQPVDPRSVNLVHKLGFRATRYTGFDTYCSTDPISPQETVCERFNTLICDAQLNPDETTLAFFFATPAPVQGAQIVSAGEGLAHLVSDRALGAQKWDVVELQFGSDKLWFVVERAETGTDLLLRVGDVPLPANQCAARLVLEPAVSVLASQNNRGIVKAEILGLGECDLLWPGCNPVRAPYAFRMIPFTYVLLEMVSPPGSARIEHRYRSDHKTTILAKILLSFEPELERFFPMRATFYGGERVSTFHFRLLNPDHTLYQLHGQPWRATFRLFSEMNPQSLITGNFVTPAPDILNPRAIQEAPYATS